MLVAVTTTLPDDFYKLEAARGSVTRDIRCDSV